MFCNTSALFPCDSVSLFHDKYLWQLSENYYQLEYTIHNTVYIFIFTITRWIIASYAINIFWAMHWKSDVQYVITFIMWNAFQLLPMMSLSWLRSPNFGSVNYVCQPFSRTIILKMKIHLSVPLTLDEIQVLLGGNIIFNPFEMNDSDYQLPLCDIDPDLCFFNELEFQVSSNCNYFNCESFVNAHNDKQKRSCYDNLSLCHANIRSLKQNFAGLERYLDLLNMKFTIIGVTETWLDEYDCDLYGLNDYNLVEKHRDSRRGGGVGIFIRNGACYSTREDLCFFSECIECVTDWNG